MIAPTDEQTRIIGETANCVAIAGPGSGKTRTLAWKIQKAIIDLPFYRGVIAISFTNRASDELKRRCLETGVENKGCFFGTIDKFRLAEIIIPFGPYLFGRPQRQLRVIKLDEVAGGEDFRRVLEMDVEELLKSECPEELSRAFAEGKVILETFGVLALVVLQRSVACQRYLRARYSHIVIDEYQDCDKWLHALFLTLEQMGLRAIAVGDVAQSIFAFAQKDPRFLILLSQDSARFQTYPLTENHRSHPSITNYSTRLLSETYAPVRVDETRVYEKVVEGTEIEIGAWLGQAIPRLAAEYGVRDMSRIGVLVRGDRTADLIQRSLTIPVKRAITTPLDEDPSLWGSVFRKMLQWVFDPRVTKYELLEDHLHFGFQRLTASRLMATLSMLEKMVNDNVSELPRAVPLFVSFAEAIYPTGKNQEAVNVLARVLSEEVLLESFAPASSDQAVLMTLHKAKGAEFDVVFHLDLYRWILPMYKGDPIQDLNLHYVGITRAREHCFLCWSTQRHRGRGDVVSAEPSEFLNMHSLEDLRIPSEL